MAVKHFTFLYDQMGAFSLHVAPILCSEIHANLVTVTFLLAKKAEGGENKNARKRDGNWWVVGPEFSYWGRPYVLKSEPF